MNKLRNLFKNEFVLKLETDVNGIEYVGEVKLTALPADYEGKDVTTREYLSSRNQKFSKKANFSKNNESVKPLATARGKIDVEGYIYPCNLGTNDYKCVFEKSVGGLISLPVYIQKGDDYMGVYYPEYVGNVILDKELNVVYKNTYTASRIFYRTEDAYKFLYNFGPCAIAFMDEKSFNSDVKQDLQRVFDMRVNHLKECFVSEEKIQEEKDIFKQAIDEIDKQYLSQSEDVATI